MDPPTPKEFLFHLDQADYEAALEIATQLDIDKDIVYKTQWNNLKHITSKDVQLLHAVQDDAWVIGQCLETIGDQWQLELEILNLGNARAQERSLPIISDWQFNPDETTITDQDKVWLRSRLYFLRYLDRLSTFVKIWSNSPATQQTSFAESYGQFRDCNLIAQAIDYARTENNVGLDAIFMHHGQEVLPQRLFILSQIPETADPSRFDLPHVSVDHEDRWIEEPWRPEKDPVELDTFGDIEELAPEHLDYLGRLHQSIQSTEYPTSAKVIAQWYKERAHAMDSVGLSSQALELIRYAQVMGVSSLEDTANDYEWLCKYVYSSQTLPQAEDQIITLDQFKRMGSFEILEGLLSDTNTNRIVDDMKRMALPWLGVCRKRQAVKKEEEEEEDDDDERPEFLLYRWILDASTAHLSWCCQVFEHSKPSLPVEDRIIKDELDLSRLVLAVVYSSDGSMEYLVRIFECLPIFEPEDIEPVEPVDMASLLPLAGTPLGLFTALQSVGRNELTPIMDLLQTHLMAAEVLARYHATVPLRWYLSDQTAEAQRQLCVRMASQAAGGVESGGAQFDRDDDWRELLDDMLRLYEDGNGIFGKLDPVEIMEIFYSSLLRCGRFKLATELMLGSTVGRIMDINKAEKLVIDAEREFFDNATTGNMYAGNMKMALDCLKVLPATSEIKKEIDLIEATHALTSEYRVADRAGNVLMPIQVRQAPNRLDLISKLINTRQGMYRQYEDVLKLTHKLGYQNDILAQVKVLSMLAGAALVDEEYETSFKLCQTTVEKAQMEPANKSKAYKDEMKQAAWQICFNFGKMDAYCDYNRRMDALAMALVLSPVEYVHDVLVVWRKLEQERAASGLPVDDPTSLDMSRYDAQAQESYGWSGLLQNTKKHQWSLGGLLKGSVHQDDMAGHERGVNGVRKRDQLRNMVGGWLF
ncbi:secretory pathway protein Sec39-domain-containing protein [Phycomyces nitens]|nr:secretory pathway protein Sec39-domain-containing protein [Phycomyces nitens]